MGTWGSGLWDNDSSLDALPELIRISPVKELPALLASWALKLWFDQCTPQEFSKGIERKSKELSRLPKPVFNELGALVREPATFARRTSRPPEHSAVIGGYCDGYFIAPMFELPEVKAVLTARARSLESDLDETFSQPPTSQIFYELDLAALGVLLSFTRAGVFPSRDRVSAWENSFDAFDKATTDEREFWDEWRDRVRPVFSLLKG